jgi:hypothetical protein
MYIQKSTHRVINVIIHIDKFVFIIRKVQTRWEFILRIIDNRIKIRVITFCLILYWFKPKYDFDHDYWKHSENQYSDRAYPKNISYFSGNIHTFSIDFGAPLLFLIFIWSKFNSPVCFDHSYTGNWWNYPSFSALVYCQRFRTLICLANDYQENHRRSYHFLKPCVSMNKLLLQFQKSFVEMSI